VAAFTKNYGSKENEGRHIYSSHAKEKIEDNNGHKRKSEI
jgi:hypothetical protein